MDLFTHLIIMPCLCSVIRVTRHRTERGQCQIETFQSPVEQIA